MRYSVPALLLAFALAPFAQSAANRSGSNQSTPTAAQSAKPPKPAKAPKVAKPLRPAKPPKAPRLAPLPRPGIDSARQDFRRLNPCPSTGKISGACPGYAIQYLIPLNRGGMDVPGNMQWRSVGVANGK